MRILALNGGGSLGYISARILELIELDYKKPIYSIFDMISGVSTGAIVGYGAAIGIPGTALVNHYERFLPKIFKDKTSFLMSFFKPYYKISDVTENLKQVYANMLIKDTLTKYMTFATQINSAVVQPKFWKSWHDKEIKAYDAISASCAAPLYFAPYSFDGNTYIDGGICSNSPAFASFIEALKLGYDVKDIKILNISLNAVSGTTNPEKTHVGLINVAKNIPITAMFGSEKLEEHQLEILLDDSYTYINADANMPIDTLDYHKMDDIARVVYRTYKPEIEKIVL